MSRRIIKSNTDVEMNSTDISRMYLTVKDEIQKQNTVIAELIQRINVLEDFMKSKQFEIASTPVPKSKSRVKSSPISDPSAPKEKNVKKPQFFKELGNSEFCSYHLINDTNDEIRHHNWQSLFKELEIDVSDIQKFTSTNYKIAIFKLCNLHITEDCYISISFTKKDITYNCKFTHEDLDEMSVEKMQTISKSRSSPKQSKVNKEIIKKENDEPIIMTNAEEFKPKLNFYKLEIFKVDDTDIIQDYKDKCEEYIKDTKKESITINKLYKFYIKEYKGRVNAPELFVELVNYFESENQKVFVQISKIKGNDVFIYKTLELETTKNDDSEDEEQEDEEEFSDDE